jgi:transglutaminase-like putative cysteine protease
MRKPLIAIVFFFAIFMFGCVGLDSLFNNNPFGDFSFDNGPSIHESATGGMYGTITDANGAPVYGAYVSLNGEKSSYYNMTDKDGRYNITGVSAGTYNLLVEKEGYTSVKYPGFAISEGYSYEWSVALKTAESHGPDIPETGGLHGTIADMKSVPLEGAFVLLTGNASYNASTDASGDYNISGIPTGAYGVVVGKQGYRNTSSNITILAGHTYSWNFTIARDCLYYPVNASVNYVVRYGRDETTYKGYTTYMIAYPDGATYQVSPDADGSLSQISTAYLAGNRMLSWRLDNSNGRYSYVKGYLYVDMKGTQAMRVLNRKETRISDASASQPAFLGSESNDESGRTMIDPYNSEIQAVAERVKAETGSDDAWTVAKAMFIWLKNNTSYYHGPESDTYTKSAIEVLHSGNGDCDELSFLYISLCRAAGIPARFVEGYMVEKNPDLYIGHVWAEFYDGEWVPVEVASSENLTFENGVLRGETGNITHILDTRFGIDLPDHVRTFVDDGTSQSIIASNGKYLYYDTMPTFSPSVYYDLAGYDKMYIAACSDGTRALVKDMG